MCGDNVSREVGNSSPAAVFIPAMLIISTTSHTRSSKFCVTKLRIHGLVQPFYDLQSGWCDVSHNVREALSDASR